MKASNVRLLLRVAGAGLLGVAVWSISEHLWWLALPLLVLGVTLTAQGVE